MMTALRPLRLRAVAVACALPLLSCPAYAQASAAAVARPLVDTAIARMGGLDSLSAVRRVRFEMITQWHSPAFDTRPYPDQPGYELHSDLRDYALHAWRSSRRFDLTNQQREIVDVVHDSIAVRRSLGGSGGVAAPATVPAGTWSTLNVAYVDERRELFA